MEFCEKCGGLIILKEGVAACASCGFKPKKKIKIQSSEKIESKDIVTVVNEKESNTYPVVEIKCLKCKSNKAYFWTQQTRSSDESETKFYKCVKCEHTWRVYR